jgi:hypothetical protein
MNLRTTYFLFASVLLVLIVFVLVLTFGTRGDAEDYLFPDLHDKTAKSEDVARIKQEIDKVEIERHNPSGETLVFEKEGTTWALAKPYKAKIDAAVIDRLVGSLIDIRLDKKAPATTLSQSGLDSPSSAVSLRRGGKTYRVLLGNLTLGSGGNVYAATGDKPKEPVVFRRSAIDEMFKSGKDSETAGTAGEALKGITDFRPRALLADGSPIAWESVQKILLKDGGKELELKKDGVNNWQFLKPNDFGPADPEGDPPGSVVDNIAGVKPLLTRLSGLQLPADAADIVEGADDFAKYGVEPNKESMRIEFGRQSGANETLLIGGKADEKGEKVYARLDGERLVVKLPAASLEPIRKLIASPKSMRDRTLTQIPAFSIDAIDIKLGGDKPFELRKVGSPPQWRVFEGGDAFENANAMAVQQLIDTLTQRRTIRDFPDSVGGDKSFGLDPPAVEISLWQEGIIKDEMKDLGFFASIYMPALVRRPSLKGEANLRLKFGKKDKDIGYVRRQVGIVSNLLSMPDATLTIAARPFADYLDPTLPSFPYSNAVKITFNRGAVKYEIEKDRGDPSSAVWKILQPPDLAGRAGDAEKLAQIVGNLQTLHAVKIVTRKATDAELERYGLKVPKVEVAVFIKDEKEPKVYQLGNETEDKLHYFAKVSGSDRVVQVGKDRFASLLNDEVSDPTIWRLDPSRITSIKITGWKKLTGGTLLTLNLVRKSATEWSVKDQADYTVDAGKAEAFAASLNLVRADHFVKGKGGPDPPHALDLQTDALSIEVTVEGEKEPYVLTIGAEEKRNNTDYYFATSNRVPGTVFLVFKDRFGELRAKGRGHLQKPK